jgi:aminoglycoside phosphotransferase (APT) family kinase protein
MPGASSSDGSLNLAAVAAFCDAHGIGSGRLRAKRLGDGHSNLTFVVERGAERFVLRRPPPPPLPPSAHDMVRESTVVAGLHRAGARVPRVLAVCADPGPLGVPFYLMTLADGVALDAELPVAVDTPGERARLGGDVIDALAEVHAIDPSAAGLASIGRPDGYLRRQVRRFIGLWAVNRTRDLPLVAAVGAFLVDTVPESGPATVVHGDYRVGNLLVASDPPARVTAILDWELATLGDPLADLGYLISTYVDRDVPPGEGILALSPVTRGDGFPTRAELAALYAARTGRSVERLAWYEALAHWKAAIFCENMYKRFLAGERSDAFARAMETGVPAKLEAAAAAAARYDRSAGSCRPSHPTRP